MMARGEIEPKHGRVFTATNPPTEWARACAVCGVGKLERMDNGRNQWVRYQGLIVHDLRRSAVRNLRIAGVPEDVKISGHRTRAVFSLYNIVSTGDITDAMRRVEVRCSRQCDTRHKCKISEKVPS